MNIHSFTHIRNIVMFSQWFLPITIVFSLFNEIESHLNHFNIAKRFILSTGRHVFFNFSLWVLIGMWYLNIQSRSLKIRIEIPIKTSFSVFDDVRDYSISMNDSQRSHNWCFDLYFLHRLPLFHLNRSIPKLKYRISTLIQT